MAFPTTPVLDNFNRANEDPLSGGGNWSGPILLNMNKMKVVSNATQQSTVIGSQSGSSFWNAATFGPGVEVYVTIPTMWINNSSDVWLWLNGNAENSSGVDGYILYISQSGGAFTWILNRKDNGVDTQLGGNIGTQAIANGDAIGLEDLNGGTLQAYYKPSGGSWGTTGTTRSDNTYTSGHIGYSKGFVDSTSILDDFGGGTIPGSSVLFSRLERGLRGICRGVQMGAR